MIHLLWQSTKGNQRKTNNDYLAIKVYNNRLIAVIVDAAEKGNNAQRLANHWANLLLLSFVESTSTSLHHLICKAHKTLVPDFLHEKASYSLINLDLANNTGEIFYVGDCRIAVINNGNTNWINRPHILSDTLNLGRDYDHILTKVLKARRFTVPDHEYFTWQKQDRLLLCTDGYWRPQLDDFGQSTDDVSVLHMTPGNSPYKFTSETHHDNYRLYT